MKTVFSIVLKTISSLACLFLLLCSMIYMPSLASVLYILGAALLFPMKRWQSKLQLKPALKVIVVVVLFFAGVSTSQMEDQTNSVEEEVTAQESIEEQAPTEKKTEESKPAEKVSDEPEVEVKEEEKVLNFLDDFTEYGYTSDQIEDMRTILVNVGITEITDMEIGNVSYGMQTVKGIAYKDKSFGGGGKEVQVRFNIENGVLYYVHIYCPSYGTANQPTYLSGLEDRRAELYYDTNGGYLKKIDWENKVVIDY